MRIFLILLFQVCLANVFAQVNSYTATVKDSENNPLIGATVNEVGTDNYT